MIPLFIGHKKDNMTEEEIIAQFLKTEKRILQIGGRESLKDLLAHDTFTRLEISDVNDFKNIPATGFDYIILTDVLELIDNPRELISHVKDLTKSVVIYEYKYDEIESIDPSWRQPWKTVGLEFFLTREFDFVNDLFLGYATLHICELPFTPKPEELEHPNAIR
jgi:hypothetical protein